MPARRGPVAALVPALLAVALAVGVLAGCADQPATGGSAVPPPRSGSADPPAPCSPSTALAGWSDALDGTEVGGESVSSLSGLAAEPDGRVLAVKDRSVLMTLDPTASRALDARPIVGPDGRPLDSEAVVIDRDGTLLVTDETGPEVFRFTPDGRFLAAFPVPPELRVAPAGRGVGNATFEGLARQPDGTLVASLERPLTGDDQGLTRLVTWTPDGRPSTQIAVPLPARTGISELAPTGDGRLLVVERGYEKATGNTVRLVLADPRGATDVAAIASITSTTVTPARTTVLADLGSCPPLGATSRQTQANPLLDNIEGMTITGRDPDGALRLLLVSDNNDRSTQVTRTYRLRTVLPPA